jgi:putative ABC transport system permease protein
MNLFKIAWRSIQQRLLASTLTGISMALGVALVISVLVIYGVVNDSFSRAAHGYNIIVGAKGGKLQLVLNTVYHLSTPIENLPWSYYQEFTKGKFASQVELAIPYCLGDNYEGYRVVGTTPDLLDKLEYAPNAKYAFAQGRNFEAEHFFEAVVGALVARRTGLKVGDEFQPTHGVREEADGHKHDAFKVVGILAPTGTPNDRAVFVNLEGFLLLDGHAKPVEAKPAAPASDHVHASQEQSEDHGDDHAHDSSDEHSAHDEHADAQGGEASADHATDDEHSHDHAHDHAHAHEHDDHHHDHVHHKPLPDEQREVTAILVRTRDHIAGLSLPRMVNKEPFAQAVMPIREIQGLFAAIVEPLQWILLVLAGLVVLVAGIGIMVSIYNSMNDRRHDIAVMRALGARRGTVMTIILAESILLAVGGGVLGILLGHGLIQLLDPIIVAQTGVSIGAMSFAKGELYLIPTLIVLAALVGLLPSLAAYRTDVAKALSDRP